MGTIPDPNYDPGDDCVFCFGVGQPLGDFPTPERIKAVFTGITDCPGKGGAINGTYILTQDPAKPCRYYWEAMPLSCEIDFVWDDGGVNKTMVNLLTISEYYFFGRSGICSLTIANEYVFGTCALILPVVGYGGQCEISWGPEI